MKKIPLLGTSGKGKFIIVDDTDFTMLSKHKWWINSEGYPYTNISKGHFERIGRLILKPKGDLVIDHINHNKLDNRRSNLRLCTRQQNQINRRRHSNNKSGYKGVYWHKHNKLWIAQLRIGKKQIIRSAKTALEAARIYDDLAGTYYPEFAVLNFPR